MSKDRFTWRLGNVDFLTVSMADSGLADLFQHYLQGTNQPINCISVGGGVAEYRFENIEAKRNAVSGFTRYVVGSILDGATPQR